MFAIVSVVLLTTKQIAQVRRDREGRNGLACAMRLTGVTQVQLAEALEITQPVVSRLVNGQYSRIDLDQSRKIAAFFGCTVDDLFPAKAEVA